MNSSLPFLIFTAIYIFKIINAHKYHIHIKHDRKIQRMLYKLLSTYKKKEKCYAKLKSSTS